MYSIDKAKIGEALNGLNAVAGTVPGPQASLIATFVGQISRELKPIQEAPPASLVPSRAAASAKRAAK